MGSVEGISEAFWELEQGRMGTTFLITHFFDRRMIYEIKDNAFTNV